MRRETGVREIVRIQAWERKLGYRCGRERDIKKANNRYKYTAKY